MNRIREVLFGSVDRNFYVRNKTQLQERNYGMLITAFSFSTCMCAFLYLMTMVVNLISNLTMFYGFFVLWFCMLTIILLTYVKKHKEWCRVMFFVYVASILYLCAWIGTVNSYDMYAVTFFVFLIFVPSLYVDMPLCSIVITIVSSFIFCLMVLINKSDPRLIQNDLLNALCVSIVSIGYGVYTTNVNLENIHAAIILKEQSTIDELTLLPNRRWFNKNISSIYEQSNVHGLNLYMLDVDFFKDYNDTYGHLMGDDCLAKISSELSKISTSLNIFASRYGGEEFIIIDDKHSYEESSSIANKIVDRISQLKIPHIKSDSGVVTISVGYVNSKISKTENYIQLINYADEALYCAKKAGRNKSCNYETKETKM
ncbi:GGDEF domain-containing protein [Anaerorhabdus sp.]|uniref:GGDEF domain-containing protein n=1 Tax=Anaerorhabdus sp. TaxID=1872524 RepID=UPI002FC8B745